MHIFLCAFNDIPDPRAGNARHDRGELLVIAFVSVLCGATSCAEMSAYGRVLADVTALAREGDVVAVDGKGVARRPRQGCEPADADDGVAPQPRGYA